MAKPTDSGVDRRVFLKQAATGAAALTSTSAITAGGPNDSQAPAADTTGSQGGAPREAEVLTQSSSGSDYMVDVLKSLGLDYVCANPGSSASAACTESVINYGGNSEPEFITCCHEESSVAMAHGYCQGRRQAARRSRARHRRPAARVDGDLQRVLRSRAGLHRARQHARRDDAAAAASSGRTACRTPPRWCATTRSGTTRQRRCQHFGESAVARLQDRDDAAVRTGRARRRHRAAGEADPAEARDAANPEAHARLAAAGRLRRRRGSRRGCWSPPTIPCSLPTRWRAPPQGWQHLIELAELLQAAVIASERPH